MKKFIQKILNAMLEMGMRELDNSAVLGVIEALSGTRLNESTG